MRSIGAAEAALEIMLQRVTDPTRQTFGKHLYEHGTIVEAIGRSRAEIDGARLLVLSAAHQIDKVRAKGAMKDIGIAKYVVPTVALSVVDRAMQSFGAEGLSQDTPLAKTWAGMRTLRLADVRFLPSQSGGTLTHRHSRALTRFTCSRLARRNYNAQPRSQSMQMRSKRRKQ